ncbi:stage III sporulation protein SpoAB [Virgibacillus phasianinus]|uniref:Stage III sporulation protein SpoAB n=1 Tax=Virgibacillus phasianinus TaxID=2017483 RepID=A0A220U533_9BACI|nr:stage III sporulation protein SpoIIIAB [Virgibacillus phasianinus]ASK63227.1 stage III sporulation protein SpoAB [Virgibacillus phasianinus]
MEWIGALLFIGTTTWIGFEISNKLRDRPKHIRQLKNALQILEAEILYSQLPLRDAFDSIAKQLPDPTRTFFQDLAINLDENKTDLFSVWSQHMEMLNRISAIGKNEKEILNQFGRTLGQHDFNQQQKHIQLAVHHLDRELEEARDNEMKYSKMAKSLGVLSGLFIVLLLI